MLHSLPERCALRRVIDPEDCRCLSTMGARVRPQVGPCEIYSDKMETGHVSLLHVTLPIFLFITIPPALHTLFRLDVLFLEGRKGEA